MRVNGSRGGPAPPGREHRIAAVSDGRADVGGILERRRRRAGVAISALLVLIAIVLVVQDGDGGEQPEAIDTAPHLVELDEVAELEGTLGHPLYSAGERPPDRLELTREADGSVYLRYLPPGVEAGDSRAGFLTVGTYPVADAVAALERTAAENETSLRTAADGARLLLNPASQGSVYLAYPGTDLQIEVYDPAPGGALELIRAGAIRPVG
jgi:hypothetical protein